MKIYEFGSLEKPTLMLLADTLCYWENTFKEFIKYTEKHFHIFAVSYDGMENDNTTFVSIEKTARDLENYISENLNGKIDIIYGSGMGGTIGTIIVSNEKISVGHLIVSGTNFNTQNSFFAKIGANKNRDDAISVFTKGATPVKISKMLKSYDTKTYAENVVKIYEIGGDKFAYISRETAYNMFYSYFTTKVPNHIVTNTKIHAFHYKFMGDIYFEKFKKVFVDPEIKIFDNEFEDMLFTYPKNLAVIIRACTGMLKNK